LATRSRSGRRPAPRDVAPDVGTSASGVGLAPGPSLASATLPRVWQGLGYRPLLDASLARPLFDFAAVRWPDTTTLAFAWGTHAVVTAGERLVAAVVAERVERAVMLYGPVVSEDTADAFEVAAQLVAVALDHATALGGETIFTRPQGLDRVWIRSGFIPVPESALPSALAGRPGAGLYAWRGGSALWTFREAPRVP
jgi:hypothetical protein